MSLKISIPRVCVNCNNTFTAQTTKTRFCSKKCNSQFLKKQDRENRLKYSEAENREINVQSKMDSLNVEKQAFKIKAVAHLLDTTPKAIYALIRSGQLQATYFSPRNTRIRREHLTEFLNQKTQKVINFEVPKPKGAVDTYELTKESGYSIHDVILLFNKKREDIYVFFKRNNVPKIHCGKEVYYSVPEVDKLYKEWLKPKKLGHEKEREANIRLATKPLKKVECYTMPECVERFKRSRATLYGMFNRRKVPKLRDGQEMLYSKKAVDRIYKLLEEGGKV